MVNVTNNKKLFFEKEQGEIIIYGAGNAGYWVGHYMIRCDIDFTCYLDKKIRHENSLYNGKPVFHPEKLKEYSGRSIRIIVTPQKYESVLSELLWLEHIYEFNALCLIPRFLHVTMHEDGYHINELLSYFRRKLFIGDTPTIISNNCSAGYIYQHLGLVMLSPTINTSIDEDDFIKLCKNPRYYLEQDMEPAQWIRPYGNPQIYKEGPTGRIGDITVSFGHVDNENGLIDRWNVMRKMINWNRLIFVACDYDKYYPAFSIKNEQAFMSLKEEHLLIVVRNTGLWGGTGYNKIFMQENYLGIKYSAIENYFDLLGWMNKEYMDTE